MTVIATLFGLFVGMSVLAFAIAMLWPEADHALEAIETLETSTRVSTARIALASRRVRTLNAALRRYRQEPRPLGGALLVVSQVEHAPVLSLLPSEYRAAEKRGFAAALKGVDRRRAASS